MTAAERQLLTDLRRALLHLHKTLLDWERADYEMTHGRMEPMQALQLIYNHEQFAWLRPMSGLIVRIDEGLDADDVVDVAALMGAAQDLTSPTAGNAPGARYHAALQELPEAVLAHGQVVALLKRGKV
ncbi:MAG: hypothetical protein ABI665_09895 [Vicinamibacterales bacterium]